jgi:hypothetical protein
MITPTLVERLRLGPDDVLVVSVPGPVSTELADRVLAVFRAQCGADARIIVLDDRITLRVVAPPA